MGIWEKFHDLLCVWQKAVVIVQVGVDHPDNFFQLWKDFAVEPWINQECLPILGKLQKCVLMFANFHVLSLEEGPKFV